MASSEIIECLLIPVAILAVAVVIDAAILELSPVELIQAMAETFQVVYGTVRN
jgi:hypothetical protein